LTARQALRVPADISVVRGWAPHFQSIKKRAAAAPPPGSAHTGV